MRILCKIPTRGRAKQCVEVVTAMRVKSVDKCDYLISVDNGDTFPDFDGAENVHVIPGESLSKIHAINRDINEWTEPWDILVVGSDDMYPVAHGWDQVIREAMQRHFPDTDGMLWFPDGYQKRLPTMPIMGRKYYSRFMQVYHPSYRAFWCDDEQRDIAQAHGKMVYIDRQLFDHLHPDNTGSKRRDRTYTMYGKDHHTDKRNYNERKAQGFPQ